MRTCHKCSNLINGEFHEEKYFYENGGHTHNDYRYYHLTCWSKLKEEKRQEREQRKQENEQKNQNKLEEELNDLNQESFRIFGIMLSSLGNPSVENVKEINKFKSKVKKFLKKVENKKLDEDLVEIDEYLKEYVSPQLLDKTSIDKKLQRKANRKCRHNNIEKYEDEPRYYCAYCWDDNSPEFLQKLAAKGFKKQNESNSNSPNHNNNPSRERERERERESNSQQEITDLANKSNKTPQERKDLAEEPFYKDPLGIVGIGIGALGLLGLIIFFINKSQKDRE